MIGSGDVGDVAVVIPCCNGERHIDRALSSVVTQPGLSMEIVVVDDGSTDRSVDRAKAFSRVQVLSTPNRGAAAARNTGLRATKAPLVKFLDADDELLPDALTEQVEAANRLGPEQIHVGGWYVRADAGQKRRHGCQRQGGGQVPNLIIHNILTSGPLHRRHLLERVNGFDERFPWNQEWNLHIRLAASGAQFLFHEQAVYCAHRRSEEGRITNKKFKTRAFVRKELDMIEWTRQSIGRSERTDVAFAFRAMRIAKSAAKLGRLADAQAALAFARAIAPRDYRRHWPSKYTAIHRLFGTRLGEKALIRYWQMSA